MIRTKAGIKLGAALLLSAGMLNGCSGRDTSLAEKTAAAEQQAIRAEKAADRAEAAADKVEKAAQHDPAVEANALPPEEEAGAPNPDKERAFDPTPPEATRPST